VIHAAGCHPDHGKHTTSAAAASSSDRLWPSDDRGASIDDEYIRGNGGPGSGNRGQGLRPPEGMRGYPSTHPLFFVFIFVFIFILIVITVSFPSTF
jgi:hypothetical protein